MQSTALLGNTHDI